VPWSVLDAVGVFVVAVVTGFALLYGLAVLVGFGLLPEMVRQQANLFVLGATVLGFTLLWVRVRYPGSVRRLRGHRLGGLAEVAWGTVTAIGVLLVLGMFSFVLQQFVGEAPVLQEDLREVARFDHLVPFLIVYSVVLAPIAEELFFRGMLFQALRDRLGVWPGIGLSAVAFSLVHVTPGQAPEAALLLFAVVFMTGVALGYLFHRRGSLLACIVMHAVFNTVQVSILVSGMA